MGGAVAGAIGDVSAGVGAQDPFRGPAPRTSQYGGSTDSDGAGDAMLPNGAVANLEECELSAGEITGWATLGPFVGLA